VALGTSSGGGGAATLGRDARSARAAAVACNSAGARPARGAVVLIHAVCCIADVYCTPTQKETTYARGSRWRTARTRSCGSTWFPALQRSAPCTAGSSTGTLPCRPACGAWQAQRARRGWSRWQTRLVPSPPAPPPCSPPHATAQLAAGLLLLLQAPARGHRRRPHRRLHHRRFPAPVRAAVPRALAVWR